MVKHITLEMMAQSMRGIPRNAVMLIRLADGQLVPLDHFKPMNFHTTESGTYEPSGTTMPSSAAPAKHGENYAVVLVPKFPG